MPRFMHARCPACVCIPQTVQFYDKGSSADGWVEENSPRSEEEVERIRSYQTVVCPTCLGEIIWSYQP